MEKKFNVSLEIIYFECNDIITTSIDHDNGYIDGGDLANLSEDIADKVRKVFNWFFLYLNLKLKELCS